MTSDRPTIMPHMFKKQTATATAAGTPGAGSWTGNDVFTFGNSTSSNGLNSGRYIVQLQDTGDVAISRLVILHNGAKVNLSGAADADLSLGSLQFVVRCWGDTPGSADARYNELLALRGLQGTMLARAMYKTTSEIYRSCLGVITTIRPGRRTEFPNALGKHAEIDATVVFERLGAWGSEYTVS